MGGGRLQGGIGGVREPWWGLLGAIPGALGGS